MLEIVEDETITKKFIFKDSANGITQLPLNVSNGTDTPQEFELEKTIHEGRYFIELPTVSNLTLSSFGNRLQNNPIRMFDTYQSYRYSNVVGKESILMIDFENANDESDYKNKNPSGHFNFSRGREFLISWKSCFIGDNQKANVIIIARALNLLVISNGSATLRYST